MHHLTQRLIFLQKKKAGLLCEWRPRINITKVNDATRMEIERLLPAIRNIFDRDDMFYKAIKRR